MAGIWLIAENREQTVELLTIGCELAAKIGARVAVFLSDDRERAQDYIDHGADEVRLLHPLPGDQSIDAYIPVIVAEARAEDPDCILLPATMRGKDMAARIASGLDTGLCSGCIALAFDEDRGSPVMERLAYGGAAVQKVACITRPVMATIPPRTYEPAAPVESRRGEIRELPAAPSSETRVVERRMRERLARDIREARVIVCAGRGIEKEEDLALVRQLADALGGEIACTRPIGAEYHWLPEGLCIGLSGAQVKPDLYFGIGVSGQVQHMTGIRNAKVIAAVNKDEQAPIFRGVDFGIVGDLYEVVPKLIGELVK